MDDIGGIFNLENLGPYLNESLSESVISIDYNQNNELLYLTYGDGLFKYGETNAVISGDKFETPLDFVVNRGNGNIYVADHGQKKILIFDSSYNLIDEIGSGTNAESEDPRGTTGLALDLNGFIYNADNYTGSTAGNFDAIKIYSPSGNLVNIINDFNGSPIQDPFSIAVDNEGFIYLSDSGGENGRILIYDKDYQEVKIIDNDVQGSPGSIVVDEFGYIYVADFADDFRLDYFFNSPLNLLESFEKIESGEFQVNVYSRNENFNFIKSFSSENIDLPVDLTIDECGSININNLKIEITFIIKK